MGMFTIVQLIPLFNLILKRIFHYKSNINNKDTKLKAIFFLSNQMKDQEPGKEIKDQIDENESKKCKQN